MTYEVSTLRSRRTSYSPRASRMATRSPTGETTSLLTAQSESLIGTGQMLVAVRKQGTHPVQLRVEARPRWDCGALATDT
jgi:hypothetical protein